MVFSSEPVVRLDKACIFQGITAILQDVTFDIEKDEFVFLIGRKRPKSHVPFMGCKVRCLFRKMVKNNKCIFYIY